MLTSCVSDPYQARANANAAIQATDNARIERAQVATLDASRLRDASTATVGSQAARLTATNAALGIAATERAATLTAVIQDTQQADDIYIAAMKRTSNMQEQQLKQTQLADGATATAYSIARVQRSEDNRARIANTIPWLIVWVGFIAALSSIYYWMQRNLRKNSILESKYGLIIFRRGHEPMPLRDLNTYNRHLRALNPPTKTEFQSVEPIRTDVQQQPSYGGIISKAARVAPAGWDSQVFPGHRALELSSEQWMTLTGVLEEMDVVEKVPNVGTRILEPYVNLRGIYQAMLDQTLVLSPTLRDYTTQRYHPEQYGTERNGRERI